LAGDPQAAVGGRLPVIEGRYDPATVNIRRVGGGEGMDST
jgi:hypothetical protein